MNLKLERGYMMKKNKNKISIKLHNILLCTVLMLFPIIGSSQFNAEIDVSMLNGNNGFVMNGAIQSDFFGGSVAYGGDINGDGIDDLLVGAVGSDPNGLLSGSTYLLLGSVIGFPTQVNTSNTIVFNGAAVFDNSGYSVNYAGDINNDGIDDFVIGAIESSSNGNSLTGRSYVVFGKLVRFASSVDLSTLNGADGFVLNGVEQFDLSGATVGSAGDLNNDGISDLFIGSINGGSNDEGECYIIYGSSNTFPSSFNLSTLNGSNGFTIKGINPNDEAGRSVSSAGDFNHDGIDDLIIGAPGANTAYVVYGTNNLFSQTLNLSSINGTNGIVFNGVTFDDQLGISVSNAGDINADGIDDIVIGADLVDTSFGVDAGASYVVFGNGSSFPAPFNLSSINGNNGFVLQGNGTNDNSGNTVNSAGDVNSDGIDDIIIGAKKADANGIDSGASYVIFGSQTPFDSHISLTSLDGNNGFSIYGLSAGDMLGSSVSYAGDINEDGLDDIIIGANNDDPNGADSGAAYIIYGRKELVFSDGFE